MLSLLFSCYGGIVAPLAAPDADIRKRRDVLLVAEAGNFLRGRLDEFRGLFIFTRVHKSSRPGMFVTSLGAESKS